MNCVAHPNTYGNYIWNKEKMEQRKKSMKLGGDDKRRGPGGFERRGYVTSICGTFFTSFDSRNL